MNIEKHTPLMQQYFDIKQQYTDTLLFFQVGDFYELFFDDAKVAASFLAITLTKRGKTKDMDIPLCGIPVHALNHYLRKLIKGGFKVALCNQLSKPIPGTVVKRGVTQVFTPGTLTDSLMLDEKSASYLLALYPTNDSYGLIFSELLTAQLFATTIPIDNKRMIEAELSRFFPDEIILPDNTIGKSHATHLKQLGYCTSFTNYTKHQQDDIAGQPVAKIWFEQQFTDATLKKIQDNPAFFGSLDIFYTYLQKNNEQALKQFKSIQFYEPDDYLVLDRSTQRNLEVIVNNNDNSRKNSLFAVVDRASTAMGSRTIKKWLLRPLVNLEAILQRQQVVSRLSHQIGLMQQLEELLGQCADLERIIGRIALKRAQLNDYLALQQSLALLPSLKIPISQLNTPLTQSIQERLADFASLVMLLQKSLNDNTTVTYIIKNGFDHELDYLRNLAENGQQAIAHLEQQEIKRTSINSLKIRYTNISGYYIEITKTNLNAVPVEYVHQQTLANCQRFTTIELSNLERDLKRAQEDMMIVETKVFDRLKRDVEAMLNPLRHAAQALAYLDGLVSFARVAHDNNYTTPTFNNQGELIIKNGRHPVIETTGQQKFIGNDTMLTNEQTLLIITGPNMGGKSTYLRQVALISLMAQCGSLVPADYANLMVLDRIFTRIGSGDNLAEGKSTFLVEMEETATICTQATKQSLVILDEVGRGTSTFDGIALAQAIIEHILQVIHARCLFATHYHELTALAEQHLNIKNYHLQCRKEGMALHFMHTVAPGIAQKSFGLEVARLAELPASIVERASVILQEMEKTPPQKPLHFSPSPQNTENQNVTTANKINNLKITQGKYHQIVSALQRIDLNELSPKQALDRLWELVEAAQKLNEEEK